MASLLGDALRDLLNPRLRGAGRVGTAKSKTNSRPLRTKR